MMLRDQERDPQAENLVEPRSYQNIVAWGEDPASPLPQPTLPLSTLLPSLLPLGPREL